LTVSANDFLTQNIYKLEVSSVIAGFCAIKEKDSEYEIMHLWVKPEYIGKGFGKMLLNETIRHVEKKEKAIIVESDPNAEAFYASQTLKLSQK